MIKALGCFEELGYEGEISAELLRGTSEPDEAAIIEYLDWGHLVVPVMGRPRMR